MMNLFNNCHVFARGLGWRGDERVEGGFWGKSRRRGDEIE